MKAMNDSMRARLLVLISREEMDLIDSISKDSMFSTGRKLSRTEVVSAILDAVASLRVTGKNMRTKEELRDYILRIISEKQGRGNGPAA